MASSRFKILAGSATAIAKYKTRVIALLFREENTRSKTEFFEFAA